jgi:hypothetical protein
MVIFFSFYLPLHPILVLTTYTKYFTPSEQALPEAVIGQEQQASPQVKGLLRTFIALRHRNYRLFFFGQMISQIGTWMQTTAQAWLVLELTHSALLLGLVGVLQFLPLMVFSLVGGVLADRVPKRTLLLVTQSVALVQATIMWLLVVTERYTSGISCSWRRCWA